MDLDPTPDQQQLLIALDRLAAPFEAAVHPAEFDLPGQAVETALEEGGFFDLCRSGGGAIDAALMVERIARLPHAVEIGASALVAPLLCDAQLPRPVALASGRPGEPVRFLDCARTLLFVEAGAVWAVAGADLEVTSCNSIFGYPYATAQGYRVPSAARLAAPAERYWTLLRVALAAEMAGTAEAAVARTTAYVKEREQFGRPIGSFQAIQHRLSECAVAVRSMKMLALKAACSLAPNDAVMAVVFAQNAARQICYDVQQFHGAIGLTLEYPLHFWSQRLRGLQGAMGGAAANAQAYADA